MQKLQVQLHISSQACLKDPNATALGRRIITHSIELIHELGFESFTFRKLGVRIGSPESSIYRYFESKYMLLLYLSNWYWSWIEYKLVFATNNLRSNGEKLETSIRILTEQVEIDTSVSHVDEVLLDRIIMKEGGKIYHTKEMESQKVQSFFEVYVRVVDQVSEFILSLDPSFKLPHMLVSTAIEGSRQQRYFSEHLPALTDTCENKNTVSDFYVELVFKAISGKGKGE